MKHFTEYIVSLTVIALIVHIGYFTDYGLDGKPNLESKVVGKLYTCIEVTLLNIILT